MTAAPCKRSVKHQKACEWQSGQNESSVSCWIRENPPLRWQKQTHICIYIINRHFDWFQGRATVERLHLRAGKAARAKGQTPTRAWQGLYLMMKINSNMKKWWIRSQDITFLLFPKSIQKNVLLLWLIPAEAQCPQTATANGCGVIVSSLGKMYQQFKIFEEHNVSLKACYSILPADFHADVLHSHIFWTISCIFFA